MENVWCTFCKEDNHLKNQCLTLIDYMSTGAPNPLGPGDGAWCEIWRSRGHRPKNFHLLQKYQSTQRILYCNFYKLVGHEQSDCHAWKLMSEKDFVVYRVQGEESLEGVVPQFPEPRGGYEVIEEE